MKKQLLLLLGVFILPIGGVFASSFFDRFDYGGDQAELEQVWEQGYSYSDSDLNAIFVLNTEDSNNSVLQVGRTYIWSDNISNWFSVKIKTTTATSFSSADYNWTGSRLILANPDNILERYEIRLYPKIDQLQLRYVDRTNRTGTFDWNDINTVSEAIPVISSATGKSVNSIDCKIDEDEWYNLFVFKTATGNWKVYILTKYNEHTCELSWRELPELKKNEYTVGLQSAGKDIVSYFDEVNLVKPTILGGSGGRRIIPQIITPTPTEELPAGNPGITEPNITNNPTSENTNNTQQSQQTTTENPVPTGTSGATGFLGLPGNTAGNIGLGILIFLVIGGIGYFFFLRPK